MAWGTSKHDCTAVLGFLLLAAAAVLAHSADAAGEEPDRIKQARVSKQAKISKVSPQIDATDSFAETCRAWALTAEQIASFFRNAMPLSQAQWHYEYQVMPCGLDGILTVGDQSYDFSLNAGGWATIRVPNSEHLIFYSCSGLHCKKLFPHSLTDEGAD